MFSREGRFVEAREAEDAQVKVPEKELTEIPAGRLSMEEISMVFEDKLIESCCGDVLVAAYNEQGESHRRRKTMTTENHSKGSEKCHQTLSQDRLDKRLAKIEVHLEILEELLLRGKEYQRYGWIFPNKLKWRMLQVKLKNRFNANLREAFRTVEYEDKGCIGEPEQGKILGDAFLTICL